MTFDLNQLIDRALATKEPDPHVLAQRLAAKIPQVERDALFASLLVERVTFRMRMQRSSAFSDEPTEDAPTPIVHASARPGGRSKWDRLRYAIAGEWKFRDDLTADDCDWLADDYEARAAANQACADEFRDLAARMRSLRVVRVGDLECAAV